MLLVTTKPLKKNDLGDFIGGTELAEPLDPMLEDQPALHRGIPKWNLVRPAGAF